MEFLPFRCCSALLSAILGLSAPTGAFGQVLDMYFIDGEANGDISDVTIPNNSVALNVAMNFNPVVIKSGSITVTIPDEFAWTGSFQNRVGDIASVSGTDNSVVITLQQDFSPQSNFELWLVLESKHWDDLPALASPVTFDFDGTITHINDNTFDVDTSWETMLLFSKGTISTVGSNTDVVGEQVIDLNVIVDPFNHLDVVYNRIAVTIPPFTSFVPSSITGLIDATYNASTRQIIAEYPEGGVRSFDFYFRIQVVEQSVIDENGFTQLPIFKPSVSFDVKTEFSKNFNDSTNTYHERSFTTFFADPSPILLRESTDMPDIVVNSIGDAPRDPNSASGFSTGGTIGSDPEVTLRSAIQGVNAGLGSKITFNIETESVPAISVATALPIIATKVEIDGTTQAAGRVEVKGNGGDFDGLHLQGGDSIVRGLLLNGFSKFAILLSKNGGNQILGNYIGFDASGAVSSETGGGINIVGTSNNQVGGIDAADRNFIGPGVSIVGASNGGEGVVPSNNNRIYNNSIGISPTGASFENAAGIFVFSGSGNRIGIENGGNVIAASEVCIWASPETDNIESLIIEENQVGLNADGTTRPNLVTGIYATAFSSRSIDGLTIRKNRVAGSLVNVAVTGHLVSNVSIAENRVGLQFNDTQQQPTGLSSNSQNSGLHISGCSDVSISDNTIAGHKWNILIGGSRQINDVSSTTTFATPFNPFALASGLTVGKRFTISGNRIGVNDSDEIPANSKYYCGIGVFGDAEEVVIDRNTIAKHDAELPKACIMLATGKTIRVSGNLIGTTAGAQVTGAFGLLITGASDVKVGAYDGGGGNVIGHNGIGVGVTGTATGLSFKQNTIGTDANGSPNFANATGVLINSTGEPAEGQPAVLLEENTISGNIGTGVSIASAHLVKLVENYIGITSQNQPLANKIGIDIGASPVHIEKNAIAHNTEKGINGSGAGVTFLTQNRIYENGDDSEQFGIVFVNPPVDAPFAAVAARTQPDNEGNVTIYLAASPPNSESPVTYEFFTDLDREYPQGRAFLFERSVSGEESFLEELVVSSSHPLATSSSITVTKTVNGQTSGFSTRSIVDTYTVPALEFRPSESDVIKLAWIKNDLFILQEGFGPNGPWFDNEATPIVDGDYHVSTISLAENDQFFRLILDPAALTLP